MAEERLELNAAERDWLDGLIAAGRNLVVHYGHSVATDELPTPVQLDEVFPRWAREPVETRVHANDVVHAFGAVLGAHLCRELQLRWILVRDEYGADLAVNGDPGDILLFPIDATAKRLDRGELVFFVPRGDGEKSPLCRGFSRSRDVRSVGDIGLEPTTSAV
jgi:hypothetical protein